MAFATNILQTVTTYNKSGIAALLNLNVWVGIGNKKFYKFNEIVANLGTSVTGDKPPRFSTQNTIAVANYLPLQQRTFTLTVNQVSSIPYAGTDFERIFHIDKPNAGPDDIGNYMKVFGNAAMIRIGQDVDAYMSGVVESSTFRFFGDGVTPINTVGQLANAYAQFVEFGAVPSMCRGILPNIITPSIINTALNQFVPIRNEDEAKSWEIGNWNNVDWLRTNVMKTHTSGTVAQTGQTLTLVSVSPDGLTLTFSGATASDANAVKAFDVFQFQFGVVGQPDVYFTSFAKQDLPVSHPVQFAALTDAGADGTGTVVITVNSYALLGPVAAATANDLQDQSLSVDLAAGMQVKGVPSHICGLMYSGDALYLAMPQLPSTDPYKGSNVMDPETGVGMRLYYGYLPGQGEQAWITQTIYGATLIPEYSMRICIPISQGIFFPGA